MVTRDRGCTNVKGGGVFNVISCNTRGRGGEVLYHVNSPLRRPYNNQHGEGRLRWEDYDNDDTSSLDPWSYSHHKLGGKPIINLATRGGEDPNNVRGDYWISNQQQEGGMIAMMCGDGCWQEWGDKGNEEEEDDKKWWGQIMRTRTTPRATRKMDTTIKLRRDGGDNDAKNWNIMGERK